MGQDGDFRHKFNPERAAESFSGKLRDENRHISRMGRTIRFYRKPRSSDKGPSTTRGFHKVKFHSTN